MIMQVMMLMIGLYFDLFGSIEVEICQYFYWVVLVLMMFVVLYFGSIFYLGVIKVISVCIVNMDVFVIIVIFGIYIVGFKVMLLKMGEVYFELICMFIFFFLLSCYLEYCLCYQVIQILVNMM